MPTYDEHPTPVRMIAELEQPYRRMEADLKEAVKELLRKGNHQLLSAMLHALLAYPDYPYDWKPVGYVDKTGRFVTVTCPPTLNSNCLWPKEKKLLEILRQEKAQGRQCWVFCVYTSTHPVLERLGEDRQRCRIHGENPGRRQSSHSESQCMDCQECPREWT